MLNSGFRCLSRFAFKRSVVQQRETIVLEYISFEALSCKGGASISISTSRALILRVLGWHLLGFTTVIMLPCMLTRGGTRLPIIQTFSILSLQLKNYGDTASQL